MHIAPPPLPGPRIQELGDTLVVTFRPRRSWGELLFFGFWLTFWTFGGIAALFSLAGAGWGGRAFLLFWLCGWAFGEAFAASQIAWQLAGREFLTVTPNQLEVRKQVGHFALKQRLHVLAIDDVRADRVPTGEDEKQRTDYRLRVVSRDVTLHVGEAMSYNEAEYVASVVRSHLHPQPRWSDDPSEYGFAPVEDPRPAIPDPAPPPDAPARELDWGRALARVAPALIGAILIALVVAAVLPPLRHPPQLPRLSLPPAPRVEPPPAPEDVARGAARRPPLRRDFDDPRSYAIATTRYALGGAPTKIESAPRCGKTVTWTRWTCRARARSRIGPFAGRSLIYRCSVGYEQQPAATPAQTILCGPEHPPLITP